MSNPVIIGNAKLWLGDCRDILPTLPKVDLILTDPPYGIGIDGQKESVNRNPKHNRKAHEFMGWDSATPERLVFELIRYKSENQIVWGGNYFRLPPSPCWLVWDKETAGVTAFADCELAWTNLPTAVRLKRYLWSGPYMRIKEERFHPTQKPFPVMEWCIERAGKVSSVLDPFMGSGTTGVACMHMGREFIGIEREPKYFDIACRRIEDAQRQGRLIA
jgi:site-specific DNA-methyltransferase (adenine-specific)/modification methylase